MTWQARAECRTFPALFDAELDEPESDAYRALRHDTARQTCLTCPVAQHCLDAALTDDTAEGIRAGYLFEREI